jgi:hypothetical protein
MPTQRENEQQESLNELLMALRQLQTATDAFEKLSLQDFYRFFSDANRSMAPGKAETKARALATRVLRSLEKGEHPDCRERLRDVHRCAEAVVTALANS